MLSIKFRDKEAISCVLSSHRQTDAGIVGGAKELETLQTLEYQEVFSGAHLWPTVHSSRRLD